ncbi:hypothetical protein LINPERHAP2_LOCUS41807 [Linum perenne]
MKHETIQNKHEAIQKSQQRGVLVFDEKSVVRTGPDIEPAQRKVQGLEVRPGLDVKTVQKKKQKKNKSHEDSYKDDKSTKKSSKIHLHMKMFLLLICTFVQDS